MARYRGRGRRSRKSRSSRFYTIRRGGTRI